MAITGYPAFDRTAAVAASLRNRMAEEARQAAGGRRADGYAGLGGDARRAVDLRAELARRESLSLVAERGEVRAAHTQTVLKRLTAIATEMSGRANGLLGMDPANATLMASSARNALREVAGLLNERFEGEAVFGGSDLDASPIPGAIETSGMVTGIADLVQGLAPGQGAAIRAQIRTLAASNEPGVTPFSERATQSALGLIEDRRRAVPVEDGLTVEIGLLPNRNAAAAQSDAPDSTGSWARDLLGGLATIAALGPNQAGMGDDFAEVVRGAIGALRAGLEGVTAEAGALGAAESRLSAARKRHEEVASQVELQLAGVEEVDLAEAITRLQSTRTQLEASYRSLSMLGGLSLSNFLR
jgi:flagellin-like hook-associated protein FlgL